MDELKKYFRQHETEMRQEMPDENRIWERLEAHRQKNNPPRLTPKFTMRFAAAACLVLLLGFGIWQWTKEDKKLAVSKAISQNIFNAMIYPSWSTSGRHGADHAK